MGLLRDDLDLGLAPHGGAMTPEEIHARILAACGAAEARNWTGAIDRRLRHARASHPEGASFAALLDEVDEAMAEEDESERQRDELIDVAVVAIRMWLGEREP